jgi:hypothetical protein
MGVTTNGQLCFGIVLPEETELPWEDHEDGFEAWWRAENGFTNDDIWGEDGERRPGITGKDIDAFFERERAFDAVHPAPVEIVNYCSGEYPMVIIAARGTVKTARRGHPVKIIAVDMMTVNLHAADDLREFVETYFPEHLGPGPEWYLSSYWG